MANITRRDIRRGEIFDYHFGTVVRSTSIVSASTSLSNGESATFTITVSNPDDRKMIALPDVTIYAGSVAAGNELIEGANITPSEWIKDGPYNDLGDNDNINTVTKVFIANVSAGSSTAIYLFVQYKDITNGASGRNAAS